ncbi:dihydroxyacid dehydratase/phosphogluconate dehydratase [Ensifer sp. WSM1721]
MHEHGRNIALVHSALCGSTNLLLHVSLNRTRFKDKNMQQFKELQRPLCV